MVGKTTRRRAKNGVMSLVPLKKRLVLKVFRFKIVLVQIFAKGLFVVVIKHEGKSISKNYLSQMIAFENTPMEIYILSTQ